MFCSKCGNQNPEESKFCAACGSPLQEGGKNTGQTGPDLNPSDSQGEAPGQVQPQPFEEHGQHQGYGQTQDCGPAIGQGAPAGPPPVDPGTGNGIKNPYDMALVVLPLIFSFLYFIKAVRTIPRIYYVMKAVGSMISGFMPFIIVLYQIGNMTVAILSIAACVALAYVLIVFAARRTRGNTEQLYMGVIGAAVLRVAAAMAEFLLFALFNFFISTFYSPLAFAKTFFYAAVTAGSLLGLLYLSGMKPFAGKKKEELLAMAKGLYPLFRDETVNIFKKIKVWMAEGQNRRGDPGFGAAQNGFSENGAASGGMAGAGPQGFGGMAGNGMAADMAPGGWAGGPVPMKTDRNFLLVVIFSILTCGIYGFYFIHTMAKDINIICAGDGEKTAGLAEYILFSILTCGIYAYIWDYKFEDRLVRNGLRYGVLISESGSTVLLWKLFGTFLCGIGLIMAPYIQVKNLNYLSKAYNEKHFR